MSTLAELEAAGEKALRIRLALEKLETARMRLMTWNTLKKPTYTFCIDPVEWRGWGPNQRSIHVPIPHGVIQQALIYEVQAAERAVIAAEGGSKG